MTAVRRVLAALAALGLAALVSGCAVLPGAPPPDAPAVPPPAPPVQLEVQAPPELAALLGAHLDLARLAVLAPGEAIAADELERLLAATPRQALGLLQTEGYFEPHIEVRREPPPADADAAAPPRVILRVEPGVRVQVRGVRIEVEGELARRAADGDRAAQATLAGVRRDWALPAGEPFRNPQWAAAKAGLLARLRADGHLGARWRETEARVDVAQASADLSAVADGGPLFRIGELRIEGLQRYPERTVRDLAGFGAGTPATEQRLIDYQERLIASGLFDAATVAVDPDPALAAATPLAVVVRERRLQELTAGVGWSTPVGARGALQYTHRRALGLDAIARIDAELAQRRQAVDLELSSYPGPGFWRWLAGGAYTRELTDTDETTGTRLRVGRSHDSRRFDRLVFAEVERAVVRSTVLPATDPRARRDAGAVSLHYHLVWRDLDDVILPTRGHALSLQAGVGQARSDAAGSGPYGRLLARYTLYHPVRGSWFTQARVELGQVLRSEGVQVPETLRFRAGGEDSVRGYAHRALGPVADGAVGAGDVLMTASAEVARPLSARLPMLWGAAFVDVGRAARSWAALRPALGAGVGLRWRSPVGPLAFDLAWGEETRAWRTHLSVGIVF
jgi:translocation and assembly module TamA